MILQADTRILLLGFVEGNFSLSTIVNHHYLQPFGRPCVFSKHLTGKIQVNHPLVRSGIATSVKNPSLVMMKMMMMMMMMMMTTMTMTMMMAFYFTQVWTFDWNHLIILRRSGHPATRRQHHAAVGGGGKAKCETKWALKITSYFKGEKNDSETPFYKIL